MLRAAAAVVAALCMAAPGASAQCLGDFDGDNMVEITELITSVNNALSNCQGPSRTPTPGGDSCPIDFSDDNFDGDPIDCFYLGRWNSACGADDLEVRWISDLANEQGQDDLVIIDFTQFSDPPLFYGARSTSPTTAQLIGWFTEEDASDLTNAPGSVTLSNNGRSLRVDPTGEPFSIELCDFVDYQGALTDVVLPATQSARSARNATPAISRAAFERLRAVRGKAVSRMDFQRK